MKIDTEKMCSYEIFKASVLLQKVYSLGMSIAESDFISVNQRSGNVYFYAEDYPYYLFIPINEETVYAGYTCEYCGEEHETDDFRTMADIDCFVSDCISNCCGGEE